MSLSRASRRRRVGVSLVVGLALVLSAGRAVAQSGEPSLSLLEAPASPAFVLLGIEPSAVERPGSVADFTASVLNATDQLSILPENYAATFAPYWLFGGGADDTFQDYRRSVPIGQTIRRTLALSVALTPTSATTEAGGVDVTSMGVGFRFSLAEGSIEDSANPGLVQLVDALQDAAATVQSRRTAMLAADSEYARLTGAYDDMRRRLTAPGVTAAPAQQDSLQAILTARDARAATILDFREVTDRVRELAGAVRLRRTGFKLDVAGGLVVDFPDRSTAEADVTRGGLWVTGGYEWDGFVALGVARYLKADHDLPDSFDAGGRVIFDGGDRFSVSLEGLYRRAIDVETVPYVPVGDPTATPIDIGSGANDYRVAGSLEYAVAQGQTVSFTLGRSFEGVQHRSGSFLAVVGFVLGLGTNRFGPL